MESKPLVRFEQALKAADSYYRTAVNARDKQYSFLAHAYLAYREGQRNKVAYAKALELRLGRAPNGWQKERPFLFLLHALLGKEQDRAQNSLPQYSKMTGALETLHACFARETPHYNKIVAYIKRNRGVRGLYEQGLKKLKQEIRHESSEQTQYPDVEANVASVEQDIVSIPEFGIRVRRSGKGSKLVLTDLEPGTYFARVQIGSNGVVREWRVEGAADPVFKPVLKRA